MSLPGHMTRPMKPLVLKPLVLLLIAGTLLGCGSSPPPVSKYVDVTGNWQLSLQIGPFTPPNLPTNPIFALSGSLSSSGSAVTGILHARTVSLPVCAGVGTDIVATGRLDTSGNLTLTAPIAGGVATINLDVNPARSPLLMGTYKVAGGPCAQPSIGLTAIEVPNISGTFTGTMTQLEPPPTGFAPSISMTAVLNQAATPNQDGEYPVTGSITTTGTCASSFPITQGVVSGNVLQTYPLSQSFPPLDGSFEGGIAPVAPETILGTYSDSKVCGFSFFAGILTRQ